MFESLSLHSSNSNNIIGNTISNATFGIELYNLGYYPLSSSNNIIDNIISNNWYGISLWDSSNNNIIYHNNFVNNIVNARDFCSNTWDDGYPSGGNYWDDYTGIDDDGDEIGDIPYNIPGGSNQDRYPLGYFKEPPVANFTYTPVNPTKNDIIQFNDTSNDTDGSIVSWWWDFGDGYYSDLQNPIHCYYFNGTYNVSLTITDDDGLTDTIYVHIVVRSPIEVVEDLIIDIEEMGLEEGLETSLIKKLNNAIQSLNNGQPIAAINQLNAFINQVEAQRGKKLTEEQADYLVAAAQAIIDSL